MGTQKTFCRSTKDVVVGTSRRKITEMYQLSPSHRARQGVISPNESSCRSESLILIFILRYLPLKLYDVLTEGNPVGAMNATEVKEGGQI